MATMKALNALKERQSREDLGFVKLYAKMRKTNELITTRDHSPYADTP
jgi:hypothetical protein